MKFHSKQKTAGHGATIVDGDKGKNMQDKPVYIYFNHDQCHNFNIEYFGESTLTATGEEILNSRWQGYDKFHQTVLNPLSYKLLTLIKTKSDRPGWYLLTGYNESDFPELSNGNA